MDPGRFTSTNKNDFAHYIDIGLKTLKACIYPSSRDYISTKQNRCLLVIIFSSVVLGNCNFFYIHRSVRRESYLITIQQDATYSVYYISVGSSTCFGCWHPSSGARTTIITASDIDYSLQLINNRSCNYSCTSSWWWVSTTETCRAAYRNVINWISRNFLDNY